MSEAFPPLFSPLQRSGQTIALAPLTRRMAEADGTPTAETAAFHARRARGGCGLIVAEETFEEDTGCRAYLSQPGIADAVHDHGGLIVLQRMHGVGASAKQSGDDLYEQSIRNVGGPWPQVTFRPARALRVAPRSKRSYRVLRRAPAARSRRASTASIH